MRRAFGVVFCCATLCLLAGCDDPIVFSAAIVPSLGHAPYAARIVCSPTTGTYTVRLPDGSTITSSENEIPVVVDRLEWTIGVTWSDGRQVRSATATARGSNARPTIHRPRLNGDAFLWTLRPWEKTLINFSPIAAGLSGPQTGVEYDGAWRIVDLRVEASEKAVGGAFMADSVYTPPFEDGAFHALFGGWIVGNACIVYPLLTMETTSQGLPYAPEALPGYTYDAFLNRNVLIGVQFPEQSAKITVVVEDDWGRRTQATFDVPVGATATWTPDFDAGGAPFNPEEPTSQETFARAVFFVSGTHDPCYHRRHCPEIHGIPAAERLYYVSETTAEAAGKRRCPSCVED